MPTSAGSTAHDEVESRLRTDPRRGLGQRRRVAARLVRVAAAGRSTAGWCAAGCGRRPSSARATRFADLRRPLPWPRRHRRTRSISAKCSSTWRARTHCGCCGECFRVLACRRRPAAARARQRALLAQLPGRSTTRSASARGPNGRTRMRAGSRCSFATSACAGSGSARFGHFHKWMWDEVSLTVALERIGFTGVERPHLSRQRDRRRRRRGSARGPHDGGHQAAP